MVFKGGREVRFELTKRLLPLPLSAVASTTQGTPLLHILAVVTSY